MEAPEIIRVSPKERRALTIAVLIALGAGFLLVRSFVSLIVVAVIMAFLFSPVYNWLLKKNKSRGRASALTLLITFFAIVIPLVIILVVTVAQAKTMINDITSAISYDSVGKSVQDALDWVNNFLTNLTGRTVAITTDQIRAELSQYLSSFANFVVDTITGWVSSIGSIFANIILYIYVFTAVLVHRDKLIRMVEELNPLGSDVTRLYLSRAGDMTKGMVRGQFIIATLQGTESALILSIAGLPYFAFFALVLSFMSIIPLGAGIVTIPIGIIMILTGNIWQGVLVIMNHLLIVTNIDNVLKPVLVPKSVRLQPALTLLAVFGGIAMFGFLGIIIGPVMMILVITTLDLYLHTSETIKVKKNAAGKKSLLSRLPWFK